MDESKGVYFVLDQSGKILASYANDLPSAKKHAENIDGLVCEMMIVWDYRRLAS